ncbi:sugar phosphate isomerase/epimerase [Pseudomonas sp. P9_35]|uniref:sugar phosphate isomerase/epimerase n=1 Tax=unclassified Pseudomonas TaxID=196821 RepID=UPI00215E33B2|nr:MULTISPECIES: sugar phosphate isomerase/epimerase [unclassified Pseudomonas]UVM64006.1 sugar phosphate isomerase/epimerase [Pseudomonas sp. B21-010]WPN66097.1 sugar phosphate isomerase/epimerase [Pseudomonas sp. P9_32]WPN66480.1 sugar phosphate isomerase/epimerase [Pseudomonas sp. P9_35]
MAIHICTAPCCWGVDDVKNPFLPPWRRVLGEAAKAGYRGIELGPYGYLPLDGTLVQALSEHDLQIVAGTIFDDLVNPANLPELLRQTHDICALLKQLPPMAQQSGQRHAGPYLVIIDWGHEARDYAAGHSDRAPRLDDARWNTMMAHIRAIADIAWHQYGIRAVIHPHAGGYIEFADELARLVDDIPDEVAGLCLDTGHLYYAGMDPVASLRTYAHRLDYLHFKDIDPVVFDQVLNERIRFFAACARGVMCPIGRGVIDYPALHSLVHELGYVGCITVEQERDPRNAGSSLDDVAASRTYLARIGF